MVEWLWSVDPRDWANPGVSSIISSLNTLGNGDVVVIHDGNQNQQTLDAPASGCPLSPGKFAFEPSPAARHRRRPDCAGLQATIVGTNGNDVLNGTPGRDVMWPDPAVTRSFRATARRHLRWFGDDTLRGGPGDDTVYGPAETTTCSAATVRTPSAATPATIPSTRTPGETPSQRNPTPASTRFGLSPRRFSPPRRPRCRPPVGRRSGPCREGRPHGHSGRPRRTSAWRAARGEGRSRRRRSPRRRRADRR